MKGLQMISQRDIIADLHVHTIASRHAFSTLYECINSAHAKGLRYLAITDHYFGDGTGLDKKNEILRLVYVNEGNVNEFGIRVLNGAELNAGQTVEERYAKRLYSLNWRLLGLHSFGMDLWNATISDVYEAFKRDADKICAFAHIEREIESINHGVYGRELTQPVQDFFDKMTSLAAEKKVYLEVNNNSLKNNNLWIADRMDFWLDLAKEKDVFLSLGTDAHFCTKIGDFTMALNLLNRHNFPKERILNCNEDLLQRLNV